MFDAVTYALAKKAGGSGGSSLPPVSSADNGKVLAVKDGAWAAGTPYVLVTVENSVASLKGSEINSLAASGVEVILQDSDGLYAYVSASGTAAVFSGISSAVEAKKVGVANNKAVTRTVKSIYSKPSGGIPETDLAQAVKDKLNKFIVTLTPNSPDFSGTMDKTVAEINAAYEAGQEIIARVVLSATSYVDSPLHTVVHDDSTYPSFEGYVIHSGTNVLVYCHTNSTNDGTTATYFTTVYSLTPAS